MSRLGSVLPASRRLTWRYELSATRQAPAATAHDARASSSLAPNGAAWFITPDVLDFQRTAHVARKRRLRLSNSAATDPGDIMSDASTLPFARLMGLAIVSVAADK